jgi:hypothetical protein
MPEIPLEEKDERRLAWLKVGVLAVVMSVLAICVVAWREPLAKRHLVPVILFAEASMLVGAIGIALTEGRYGSVWRLSFAAPRLVLRRDERVMHELAGDDLTVACVSIWPQAKPGVKRNPIVDRVSMRAGGQEVDLLFMDRARFDRAKRRAEAAELPLRFEHRWG